MPFNNMGAHSYAVAFVNIGNYEPCPLCPQTHEVVLERLGLENDLGYKVIVSISSPIMKYILQF